MQVEVSKDMLHEKLALVEKVSGKHVTLPVLQGVYLEAKEGTLTLRATNLDVGIEATVTAKVATPGVVVVTGSVLLGLLSTLPKGGVVEIKETSGHVSVTSGKSVTNLNVLDATEFPKLPQVDGGVTGTVAAQDMVSGIRSVVFAASHSTIKPELASVFVSSENDRIVFVATDSFRLAEKSVRLKKTVAEGSFLLPVRNAPDVVRVLEMCEGEAEIAFNANQLSLQFDGVYVTSRLVDGTFPDYGQIIPKEFATEIVVLYKDLQTALRKTSLFADAFNQVRFSVEPNKKKITISAASNEVGDVEDVLAGTIEGETLAASFNQKYLSDSLQSIHSDSVICSFSGVGRPMIMKGVSDDSFLYLVMPMNK